MSLLVYEEETIEELGNAVRELTGSDETQTVKDMTNTLKGYKPSGDHDAHYSEGLEFGINEWSGAAFLAGIGTCTDLNIVVPPYYQGLPIEYVNDFAFEDIPIYTIILPDSITLIGESAFNSCDLVGVQLPARLISIGEWAFANNRLSYIFLPNNLEQIETGAFLNNSLIELYLPDSVQEIWADAFANNKLSKIILPKNIEVLEENCFGGEGNRVDSIVIPKSAYHVGILNENWFDDELHGFESYSTIIYFEAASSLALQVDPEYCRHDNVYWDCNRYLGPNVLKADQDWYDQRYSISGYGEFVISGLPYIEIYSGEGYTIDYFDWDDSSKDDYILTVREIIVREYEDDWNHLFRRGFEYELKQGEEILLSDSHLGQHRIDIYCYLDCYDYKCVVTRRA